MPQNMSPGDLFAALTQIEPELATLVGEDKRPEFAEALKRQKENLRQGQSIEEQQRWAQAVIAAAVRYPALRTRLNSGRITCAALRQLIEPDLKEFMKSARLDVSENQIDQSVTAALQLVSPEFPDRVITELGQLEDAMNKRQVHYVLEKDKVAAQLTKFSNLRLRFDVTEVLELFGHGILFAHELPHGPPPSLSGSVCFSSFAVCTRIFIRA